MIHGGGISDWQFHAGASLTVHYGLRIHCCGFHTNAIATDEWEIGQCYTLDLNHLSLKQ